MIDKKKLIEKLNKHYGKVKTMYHESGRDPLFAAELSALDEVFKIIKSEDILYCDTDSIIVSEKWIPCSEKLPEIGQTVLVSVAKDMILKNEVILMDYCEFLKHLFEDGSILAWKPLPEPYRAEKGE